MAGVRITCVDPDDPTTEQTVTIRDDQFMVICGADRYVANEQVYANGTNVVTIKKEQG